MKSITFLLPSGTGSPAGGSKVVFEYANRFVADGFQVHIVMPASLLWWECSLKEKVKAVIRFPYAFISKRHLPYKWFKLDCRVKLHYTWNLCQCFVPKADVYVATAIETSEFLNSYKGIPIENKFYLVQGYEDWNWGEERYLQSLRQNLNKITISPFLKETIEKQGKSAELVENGFDFNYFNLIIPITGKDKYRVVLLYHTNALKGVDDAVKAIEIAREKYPQIRANFFGFPYRPVNLPSWIDYYKEPDKETHNRIYNEAAIFIGPSHSEGFCLTPPEAMMCGCAVACTDIGGYTVVCKDGFNALVSEVKNPEDLAGNIIKLIEDDELRYRIAQNGNKMIQEYTWEKAYSKFKTIID